MGQAGKSTTTLENLIAAYRDTKSRHDAATATFHRANRIAQKLCGRHGWDHAFVLAGVSLADERMIAASINERRAFEVLKRVFHRSDVLARTLALGKIFDSTSIPANENAPRRFGECST